tara:strand:- start:73 stop:810 length:738 start_codon:yes stop_codon:yes gene_type:complete
MKITIFTSNNLRHNYLVNLFSKKFEKIYVFQETRSLFPGQYNSHYPKSDYIKKYFKGVDNAQNKFFGKNNRFIKAKNVKIVPLSCGDLNLVEIKKYSEFFNSNFYVVFGSSYIKGKLLSYLIKKKAINIHMGLSPYYRGTDCNFWALYDGNKEKVGATIHMLSAKLDGGRIIEYGYPDKKFKNPYDYTMSVTRNVIKKLLLILNNKRISYLSFKRQNILKEIRYSQKKEFNEIVVKKFFKKYNLK